MLSNCIYKKEDWDINGNTSCYWNPAGNILGLYPVTAMAEFQIIRALFELFPYRFLSLDHELLALPLAFSVPVIAGSLQIFVYVTQGTLCTPAPTANSLYKLDICLGK